MSHHKNEKYEDLVKYFAQSGYSQLEISSGNQSIELKRSMGHEVILSETGETPVVEEIVPEQSEPGHQESNPSGKTIEKIVSNRVGWFSPRVKVGDEIQEGQILGSLKSMNITQELKADRSGVVRKMLVRDGEGVAYGEALLELEV